MLDLLEHQQETDDQSVEDRRRRERSATCSTSSIFFLIGFVLAFIVKDWGLTYGQSGAILLASGVSAPFGSLFYGWLADKVVPPAPR